MELSQGWALSAACVAAVSDLWRRRIPNWITLGTFVAGIAMNVWLHGAPGILIAGAGAALGLGMLLPFYFMRAMGAGDVKLLAALGAVLGPQALVSVAVYSALAGGALSLLVLVMRGQLLMGVNELLFQRRLPRLSGLTAPYGVAIAAGVCLSLLLPGVLG